MYLALNYRSLLYVFSANLWREGFIIDFYSNIILY